MLLRRSRRQPAEVGRRLRRAFEDLGATYVKFGQLIGSSPGAFGHALSDEFRSCLDTGPDVSFAEVRAAVEAATGEPLERTFTSFDRKAVAGASIAVVHHAVLRDGREVAVKVLRPHIAERVALDLDIMEPLLKHIALRGVGMAGPMYRFVRGFRTQIAEELDLRNEARTMTHFRDLLRGEAHLSSIVIPEPILSAEKVLVMEFLDGVAIDDVESIAAMGHDAGAVMIDMLRAWFLTGLRDGMFHGDIHAGNLLLLRDGRVGVIDWGIVGRLDADMRYLFRRFVEAVLGDTTAWPEIFEFVKEMTPLPIGDGAESEVDEITDILTKPFGEVDLTGAFSGPEGRRDEPVRTRADRRARRARVREFRKTILADGFIDTGFAQANFLLFKQLLYFERYGKLYLADSALMGDREWLEHVLAITAPGASSVGDERLDLRARDEADHLTSHFSKGSRRDAEHQADVR
ncbi:MAG: hypothetical protein V7636_231 [Actinomycetota bacterium]